MSLMTLAYVQSHEIRNLVKKTAVPKREEGIGHPGTLLYAPLTVEPLGR